MKKQNVWRARLLRNTGTDAERKLWQRLRSRQLSGFKFARQEPVGPYVVDFVCRRTKLIVEIDGGQHNIGNNDDVRTKALNDLGYRVVRFWNNEVLGNIEGVLAELDLMLKVRLTPPPHPNPLPVGEREL